MILQLDLDEGVVQYRQYACDASDHEPVTDACRHADDGWHNTAVNADGFHRTAHVPRVNCSLRAVSDSVVCLIRSICLLSLVLNVQF